MLIFIAAVIIQFGQSEYMSTITTGLPIFNGVPNFPLAIRAESIGIVGDDSLAFGGKVAKFIAVFNDGIVSFHILIIAQVSDLSTDKTISFSDIFKFEFSIQMKIVKWYFHRIKILSFRME